MQTNDYIPTALDDTASATFSDKQREGEKAQTEKKSPKPDYSAFFLPLDIENAPAATPTQEQNPNQPFIAGMSNHAQAVVRIPTGIAYFDEKLQNGTVNLVDGWLARTILGIDLSKHTTLDMNVNARVKNISVTKDYDTLAGLANTGALGLKAVDLAKQRGRKGLGWLNPARWNENASFVGGATRWAYDNFASWLPMTSESVRFGTAAKQFENNQAINVLSDGKATNYDKERASEMYGSKLRDVQEYSVVVGEGIGSAVTKMDTIISNLEAKGEVVPLVLYGTRNYYDAAQKALITKGKKFDLSEFNKSYVDKTGDYGRYVLDYVSQLQGN